MSEITGKKVDGMKIFKSLLASPLLCLGLFLPASAQSVIRYTESDGVIANPERGLFAYSDDLRGKKEPLDLTHIEDGQTVVYRQYSLLNYRKRPLDKTYMDFLSEDAKTAKDAGVKMIVRFSYADDGKLSKNCDNHDSSYASAAVVNQHITSLKDYFLKWKNVIALVHAGFIGDYGEWAFAHSDFGICEPNINYRARAEMLRLLLDAVPAEIPISLRTPRYKSNILEEWRRAGLPQDQISAFARRLGFANDCFLDNEDDQETFKSDAEREYLRKETKDVPMVGESCYSAHMKNPYADWSNAKEELKNQHWTLLSSVDQGRFWTPSCFCDNPKPEKTVLCTESKCKPGDNCKKCKCPHGGKCVPFTRWDAQQVKELSQKLGYRLYLTQAEFAEEVKVNDQLIVKVSLSNAGWAAPYRNRRVEVYLCKSDSGACPDSEKRFGILNQLIDIRAWYSSTPSAPVKFSATIPTSGLSPGTYYLYLRLPDDDKDLSNKPKYSIRFANIPDGTDQNEKKRPNIFGWNVTSGANRFGSVAIK
jgi:hypothetical protein